MESRQAVLDLSTAKALEDGVESSDSNQSCPKACDSWHCRTVKERGEGPRMFYECWILSAIGLLVVAALG